MLDNTAQLALARRFQREGVIEQSACDSWEWVLSHAQPNGMISKAFEDSIFVVLGANAALGPYEPLLALGATVAAVDLPRPEVWTRLVKVAEQSAGTLLAPEIDGKLGDYTS